EVAAERKRFRAGIVRSPLWRGPDRLVESFAVLPELRRALPEARLPFERPRIFASMFVTAAAVKAVRESQLRPLAQELVSGLLAVAPAALALRGGELAAYHGAEHVSIGSYEHGESRPKEHERCGSHLIGPLIATQAVANALATKAPERLRASARAAATVGAVAASTELFRWMLSNPDKALSKALARPGHELQHRLATAEPTEAQLEVAEAA